MFSRTWLFTTLLVMLGMALCVRLGIWQLDRLAQRRAFNTQVKTTRGMSPLNLNSQAAEHLTEMEWRAIQATGRYDFANQVALRNQYYGDQYGYHLITPLIISRNVPPPGSTPQAILVDRGWIPGDGNATPVDWRKYDVSGMVMVSGQIRLSSPKPAFGGNADPTESPDGGSLEIWNNLDLERIARQMAYPVLPVYIQLDKNEEGASQPIPVQPELDLTEGPHLGYALQWLAFSALLFFGYPIYIQKQEAKRK